MNFYFYLNEQEDLIKVKNEILKNCHPFLDDFYSKFTKMNLFRGDKRTNIDTFTIYSVLKDRRPLDNKLATHEYLNSLYKSKFGINLRSECVFCSSDFNEILRTYTKGLNKKEIYYIIPIGNYEIYWNKKIKDMYWYFQDEVPLLHELDSINRVTNLFDLLFNSLNDVVDSQFINIDNNIEDIMDYFKFNNYSLYLIDKKFYLFIKQGKSSIRYNLKTFLEKEYENSIKTYEEIEITANFIQPFILKLVSLIRKKIEKDVLNNTIKGNLSQAIKSGNEIMIDCKKYYLINMEYWEKNRFDEFFTGEDD